MNLGGVDVSLDDIQDRHVLPFSGWCADHDVVWMEKSSHHIQDSRFSDIRHLPFNSQWSVASHKEMASGGWNQRSH